MDEFQLVKTLLDGKKTKVKKLASTNLLSSKALKRKLYTVLKSQSYLCSCPKSFNVVTAHTKSNKLIWKEI